METPIETGSPAAAWHLACSSASWLSQEIHSLAGFWQPIVLVGLALALISATRKWAGQAAQ